MVAEKETGRTPVEGDPASSVANVPAIVDRRDQEPRGRWENRCDYIWDLADRRLMICDRPDGHRGLHHGRIVRTKYVSDAPSVVLGYGARP